MREEVLMNLMEIVKSLTDVFGKTFLAFGFEKIFHHAATNPYGSSCG